jgi:hypothetical protein
VALVVRVITFEPFVTVIAAPVVGGPENVPIRDAVAGALPVKLWVPTVTVELVVALFVVTTPVWVAGTPAPMFWFQSFFTGCGGVGAFPCEVPEETVMGPFTLAWPDAAADACGVLPRFNCCNW